MGIQINKCSVIYFTETRLHRHISDKKVTIARIQMVRVNRDIGRNRKTKEGRVVVCVNNRQCNLRYITVKERMRRDRDTKHGTVTRGRLCRGFSLGFRTVTPLLYIVGWLLID